MINLESKELSNICFWANGNEPSQPYKVNVNGHTLNCIAWFSKEHKTDVYLFHGNGENVTHYTKSYAKLFDKAKCNVFIFEYRGYSRSSGKATLLNVLSDAEEVYKKTKISRKRTIIFGKSLGAIPAIHLATKFKLDKLIIDHGIFDVKSWLISEINKHLFTFRGELSELLKEIDMYLNNEIKIQSFSGKILAFHSKNDSLINFEHALKLSEFALKAKTRLVEFNNCDHNSYLIINTEEYWRELKEFISK